MIGLMAVSTRQESGCFALETVAVLIECGDYGICRAFNGNEYSGKRQAPFFINRLAIFNDYAGIDVDLGLATTSDFSAVDDEYVPWFTDL